MLLCAILSVTPNRALHHTLALILVVSILAALSHAIFDIVYHAGGVPNPSLPVFPLFSLKPEWDPFRIASLCVDIITAIIAAVCMCVSVSPLSSAPGGIGTAVLRLPRAAHPWVVACALEVALVARTNLWVSPPLIFLGAWCLSLWAPRAALKVCRFSAFAIAGVLLLAATSTAHEALPVLADFAPGQLDRTAVILLLALAAVALTASLGELTTATPPVPPLLAIAVCGAAPLFTVPLSSPQYVIVACALAAAPSLLSSRAAGLAAVTLALLGLSAAVTCAAMLSSLGEWSLGGYRSPSLAFDSLQWPHTACAAILAAVWHTHAAPWLLPASVGPALTAAALVSVRTPAAAAWAGVVFALQLANPPRRPPPRWVSVAAAVLLAVTAMVAVLLSGYGGEVPAVVAALSLPTPSAAELAVRIAAAIAASAALAEPRVSAPPAVDVQAVALPDAAAAAGSLAQSVRVVHVAAHSLAVVGVAACAVSSASKGSSLYAAAFAALAVTRLLLPFSRAPAGRGGWPESGVESVWVLVATLCVSAVGCIPAIAYASSLPDWLGAASTPHVAVVAAALTGLVAVVFVTRPLTSAAAASAAAAAAAANPGGGRLSDGRARDRDSGMCDEPRDSGLFVPLLAVDAPPPQPPPRLAATFAHKLARGAAAINAVCPPRWVTVFLTPPAVLVAASPATPTLLGAIPALAAALLAFFPLSPAFRTFATVAAGVAAVVPIAAGVPPIAEAVERTIGAQWAASAGLTPTPSGLRVAAVLAIVALAGASARSSRPAPLGPDSKLAAAAGLLAAPVAVVAWAAALYVGMADVSGAAACAVLAFYVVAPPTRPAANVVAALVAAAFFSWGLLWRSPTPPFVADKLDEADATYLLAHGASEGELLALAVAYFASTQAFHAARAAPPASPGPALAVDGRLRAIDSVLVASPVAAACVLAVLWAIPSPLTLFALIRMGVAATVLALPNRFAGCGPKAWLPLMAAAILPAAARLAALAPPLARVPQGGDVASVWSVLGIGGELPTSERVVCAAAVAVAMLEYLILSSPSGVHAAAALAVAAPMRATRAAAQLSHVRRVLAARAAAAGEVMTRQSAVLAAAAGCSASDPAGFDAAVRAAAGSAEACEIHAVASLMAAGADEAAPPARVQLQQPVAGTSPVAMSPVVAGRSFGASAPETSVPSTSPVVAAEDDHDGCAAGPRESSASPAPTMAARLRCELQAWSERARAAAPVVADALLARSDVGVCLLAALSLAVFPSALSALILLLSLVAALPAPPPLQEDTLSRPTRPVHIPAHSPYPSSLRAPGAARVPRAPSPTTGRPSGASSGWDLVGSQRGARGGGTEDDDAASVEWTVVAAAALRRAGRVMPYVLVGTALFVFVVRAAMAVVVQHEVQWEWPSAHALIVGDGAALSLDLLLLAAASLHAVRVHARPDLTALGGEPRDFLWISFPCAGGVLVASLFAVSSGALASRSAIGSPLSSTLPGSFVAVVFVIFCFLLCDAAVCGLKLRPAKYAMTVAAAVGLVAFALSSASATSRPRLAPAALVLTLIAAAYACVSALQVRHGFPSFLPHSIFAGRYSLGYDVAYSAYRAVPFAFEISTLLAWASRPSSLTLGQTFAAEDMWSELHQQGLLIAGAKRERKRGRDGRISGIDRCLRGFGVLLLLSCVLFMPLVFFSSLSPLLSLNVADSASVQFDFIAPTPPFFSAYTPYLPPLASSDLLRAVSRTHGSIRSYALDNGDFGLQVVEVTGNGSSLWSPAPPAFYGVLETLRDLARPVALSVKITVLRQPSSGEREVSLTMLSSVRNESRLALADALENLTHALPPAQSPWVELPEVYPPFLQSGSSTLTPAGDGRGDCRVAVASSLTPQGGRAEWFVMECRALLRYGNDAAAVDADDDDHDCAVHTADPDCPNYDGADRNLPVWGPPVLAIFCSRVATGGGALAALAGMGLVAVYTTFVLALGRCLRSGFTGQALKQHILTIPDVSRLIALCECVFAARRVGDLRAEARLYRQLTAVFADPHHLRRWGMTVPPPPRHSRPPRSDCESGGDDSPPHPRRAEVSRVTPGQPPADEEAARDISPPSPTPDKPPELQAVRAAARTKTPDPDPADPPGPRASPSLGERAARASAKSGRGAAVAPPVAARAGAPAPKQRRRASPPPPPARESYQDEE